MRLFILAGSVAGFALALRFVRRLRRTLIWGRLPGAVPLIPFIASGAASDCNGAVAILWAGRGRPRWVRWATTGAALVGLVATATLLPVAQREAAKRRATVDHAARAAANMHANFCGILTAHRVTFSASPLLTSQMTARRMLRHPRRAILAI